jgi:hypothetical protein
VKADILHCCSHDGRMTEVSDLEPANLRECNLHPKTMVRGRWIKLGNPK